jgi:hypothetical protein
MSEKFHSTHLVEVITSFYWNVNAIIIIIIITIIIIIITIIIIISVKGQMTVLKQRP